MPGDCGKWSSELGWSNRSAGQMHSCDLNHIALNLLDKKVKKKVLKKFLKNNSSIYDAVYL